MDKEALDMCSGSLGENPVLLAALKRAQLALNPASLLDYPPAMGLESLRVAFHRLLKIHVEHQVMVTPSATTALYMLLFDFKNRAQNVMVHVQQPCFFGVNRQLRDLTVPFLSWEDVDQLELNVKKVGTSFQNLIYVTSNLRAIDGRSLDNDEKKRIVTLQNERGVQVLEDNPNDLLAFNGEFPTRIYGEVPGQTIYVGSTSKILAPGLRLGSIGTSMDRLERLRSLQIGMTIAPPSYSQAMALEALSGDYLAELRSFYKQKWEKFRSLLLEYGLENFDEVEGGVFARVHISPTKDVQEVVRIAASKGIKLEENRFYYADGRNRPFVRMNFVHQSNDDNERAIRILSPIIKQ